MKTKSYNFKGLNFNVDFSDFVVTQLKGKLIRSKTVHEQMILHTFRNYKNPTNFYCGFENDKGVIQYIMACDIEEGRRELHLRLDFFNYVNHHLDKMFVNLHKVNNVK